MIGIICAMNLEVEGILDLMTEREESGRFGMTFYKGKLGSTEIVAVECGVGKVNAAICTQVMIDMYSPECIINSGVAGSLSRDVSVGDVVIATSAVQHDYDTTGLGEPRAMLTVAGKNIINFEADAKLSEKLERSARKLENTRVFRGVIATGDEFVHSTERRLHLGEEFSALACEMEGGAIAHVCYRAKVPFCILRSISDDLCNNTSISFDEFKVMAANKTVDILSDALK